jgi:hypothetical protein
MRSALESLEFSGSGVRKGSVGCSVGRSNFRCRVDRRTDEGVCYFELCLRNLGVLLPWNLALRRPAMELLTSGG